MWEVKHYAELMRIFDANQEAFERAYDLNDFSIMAPFFTEDAVYEVKSAPEASSRSEGRDAIIAQFGKSVNGLDRKFPQKRIIEVTEPVQIRRNYIRFDGIIHYPAPGVPTLTVEMSEEAWFRDGQICRMVDTIPAEQIAKLRPHFTQYAAQIAAAHKEMQGE